MNTAEAIKRIEDLVALLEKKSAEVERLRAALKPFAEYANHYDMHEYGDPARALLISDNDHPGQWQGPTVGELRTAREALSVGHQQERKSDGG